MHTCTPLPTTPVGGTVEGDWIEKVQRDMREMKFHCDSRYADWDTLMTEVRQSIEKHMPTPKSQEAVMDVEKAYNRVTDVYVDSDNMKRRVLNFERFEVYIKSLPIAGKKYST